MLDIQLSNASGVPFYRQIVDQLALLVRTGKIPEGTLLPSYRDLASQLRVSLITVRRAYADLEACGLIIRRQGQGTFVSDSVELASKEQALTEARRMLDQALSGTRQLGLTWQEIEHLFQELLVRKGEDNENR